VPETLDDSDADTDADGESDADVDDVDVLDGPVEMVCVMVLDDDGAAEPDCPEKVGVDVVDVSWFVSVIVADVVDDCEREREGETEAVAHCDEEPDADRDHVLDTVG